MGMLGTGLPVSMYTTKTPIDMWRFNVPQLKEFLAFSVNDRYQLNYFICITERLQCIDNYFFKIKIVFYRLYLLPSASWKENDLSWYIFVIRHTVEYRTPAFTLLFSWRLHITIKYILPCLRLWYVNVVTVILIAYTPEVAYHFRRQYTKKTEHGYDSKQAYFFVRMFPPISVPILIFLFVKRGDNLNLSSASKQKWRHSYRI
jgi:hypothetical protein